ncbi:uncharacterized protein F4822DRAFT_402916 [Hypoxylon trugodes]|uniref:uncharacterized protein n=1 Tax=Hypoxylon trugodes TaxID=326681 RepID=UPI00219F6F47|nr:uncharacterized protein F4822DRAFT_402916 [Hypoxylon trugodes]KAI1388464.1 hypothetical protein F4822DRAFT_402916 [Hypoxylon trugodes]
MRPLANPQAQQTQPIHGTTSHVDSHSPHPTHRGDQDNKTPPTSTVPVTRRLSLSSPKMLLSDLYKSTKAPLSKWRHSHIITTTPPDYDPDLVSRDKTKQKDAVKRILAGKIRNDWSFEWPPTSMKAHSTENVIRTDVPEIHEDVVIDGTESEDDDDAVSTYSTVSEDLTHYRPRSEWLSDMPDDDEDDNIPGSPSAYRFDNPDAVGVSVKAAAIAKSAKRRRDLRSEMEWNKGLACFNARRDAWTGAKAARVRPKVVPPTPTSPAAKRISWWHVSVASTPSSPTESTNVTMPLSPIATRTSGDTTVATSSDTEYRDSRVKEDTSAYPVETLIPIPEPLLPAVTPMRTSITPAAYPTIYDKIVLQSATPSCPINLSDVVRSCVTGWRRDGEWPPRSMEPPPVVAVRRKKKESSPDSKNHNKRISINFLGRRLSVGAEPSSPVVESTPHHPEKEEPCPMSTNKAFRKSLQRVLGLNHESSHRAVAL